ncbi:MAG: DUF4920 domain-containing protein [Candidatus Kapabacteria bacterium]|jgi:hypothetical protein|nr:DUF4920 domain-containing protein [Candidatus Kapabacteria bacterium]
MNRSFSLHKALVTGFAAALLSIAFVACAKQEAPKEAQQTPSAQETKPQYKAYGDSVQSTSAPLALSEAVKAPSKEKLVRVTAKVTEVCQKKGCWMMLTDGNNTIRVTFKDYGFFMPKDLAGKTIIAEGLVTEEVLKEADARHYAEDAGKSKEEIEKIKGDQKTVTMVAQSVFVPMN